ncbi:FAD-dependent oxidoreductase [Streptomyces sp. NPDC046909]|uniref:NAD(P)/FAD-dependent oxidoreductase n=1 Tax=Streptomyces sp. NPDC046909 TaxID=3155617 RepID=UPI0033C7D0BB
MSVQRLVVVGASLAGLRAVEAARKAGFDGSITLIGAESHLPYDRPPLSKAFLEPEAEGPAGPYFRDEHHLREVLRTELRLGRPATGLDTERRVVRVGDDEVPYDALVIATGTTPRDLPGIDGLAGVYSLRTLDDALTIRSALKGSTKAVVIGAGFIGSEFASAAKKWQVDVTIVESLTTPLVRAVGVEMGDAIASLHQRNGTTLRCGVGVERLEGDGKVERVVLSDGSVIEADLVVVGVGVSPATAWLEASGLTLDNGVVCDERLWTGAPGVYAAGDVVNWPNAVMGERQRMENWTAAAEQGAVAARNAVDPENAKPYGTVPYFWSDWYDVRIQSVGSPQADEVRVVDGHLDGGDRWVALYRRGDRLIGALTVNAPTEIMKYRALVGKGASWEEGLEFAARRARRSDQPAPVSR